jgi:hypothetical protein
MQCSWATSLFCFGSWCSWFLLHSTIELEGFIWYCLLDPSGPCPWSCLVIIQLHNYFLQLLAACHRFSLQGPLEMQRWVATFWIRSSSDVPGSSWACITFTYPFWELTPNAVFVLKPISLFGPFSGFRHLWQGGIVCFIWFGGRTWEVIANRNRGEVSKIRLNVALQLTIRR